MRDISMEIKVGMVVILAIVILLFTIIWVKEYRFAVSHHEITVIFDEIGTLEEGDPVKALGVKKGSVKKIILDGNNVRVILSLNTDVILKDDAKISVMNVGLMGERFVAIRPGKSEMPLDTSRAIHGEYDTGISEVFGMMGDIIAEVRALIASLDGTFGEKGQGPEFRQLITDLQQLTANANRFFDSNYQQMEKAVNDLASATGNMKELMDTNRVELDQTIANLAELSGTMKQLSERMNDLTSRIAAGEGTLGKTVTQDSLYNDLKRTVNNLDSLITDFKENPKRYVKVSLF